ncbi:MAG: tRNA (cytidine(34)-2'-O)-methyltransferase [Planctomycetes bacterium]|nr:tRNA (cytidine(34)-2'-O)-methyltransferase [Planctomycetota bacterium]
MGAPRTPGAGRRWRRATPSTHATLAGLEIVLVHPEIPHNTGCAARLAAGLGLRLHLVEPLGFSLDDRYLKRAGLDYWPLVDLVVHRSWSSAAAALSAGSQRPFASRLRLFTARGGRSLFEAAFEADDVLVFGSESRGLPARLLQEHAEQRVYVPIRSGVRSLNLANVACLGVYTALHRAGVPLPANDGAYAAHPRAAEDVRPSSRVERVDA